MSDFKCEVVRVKIVPHDNADALEIAMVGDYKSVVKKNQFKDGDLAVYLPEQAVLPEWLLKELGFWDEEKNKGMLNGSAGNRIRAVRLRGVMSQGILLGGVNLPENREANTIQQLCVGGKQSYLDAGECSGYEREISTFNEGDDVAEFLGITKYEPPIPATMMGRVRSKAQGSDGDSTINYDFENIKKYPDLFADYDDVVITEKIHGTFCYVAIAPPKLVAAKGWADDRILTSKGLGKRGIVLDPDDETSVYARAVKKYGLHDKIRAAIDEVGDNSEETDIAFICCEVFGKGVQDLHYGGDAGDVHIRVFDIGTKDYVTGDVSYADFESMKEVCAYLELPMVPVLYEGKFNKQKMLELTNGKETVSGKEMHIREGVVVKCANEFRDRKYGRRIAKSVSDDYLLRKSGTEYN